MNPLYKTPTSNVIHILPTTLTTAQNVNPTTSTLPVFQLNQLLLSQTATPEPPSAAPLHGNYHHPNLFTTYPVDQT